MPTVAEGEAPGGPRPDAALLVRAGVVLYALLFGLALAGSSCAGRSLVYASAEDASAGVDWLRDVASGLGIGVALVVASRVMSTHLAAGRTLRRALAGTLGTLDLGTCLLLAAISALGEEAFFRGALQPQVGLVAASAIFGLAHFVPRREFLAWPVFGCAAGLVFGALFVATGNLVAPTLAHFCVNALNLRWLGSGRGGDPAPGDSGA